MNTIEELYFGKINPQEKFFDEHSEYAYLLRIIAENKENLQKKLSGDEAVSFSKMIDAMSELADLENKENFIDGFHLGANIILDILK